MKTKTVALIASMLLMINCPAVADEGQDFVAAFAAAVNGKSKATWEAFLSPASRACLAGPGRKMLEQIFARDSRANVLPDSKVWVTRIGATDELIAEGMLSYGDRPTHYFQIDLGPPGRATGSLIRYGRLQDGRWQYVMGCPTSEGLQRAKQATQERAAAEADTQARAKNLPPKVAAEARQLIAAGKIIEAARVVSKAIGVELTVAYGIVRALENNTSQR